MKEEKPHYANASRQFILNDYLPKEATTAAA
jgi:hypothetical protein